MTKEPMNLKEQIRSDMEAEEQAELRGCCSSALTEAAQKQLGNKRNLQLHVIVENNDSDVEDGERMKPVCNLRCLHQEGMNENER